MSQELSRREEVAKFSEFLSKIRGFMTEHQILEILTNPLMEAIIPERGVDPVPVTLGVGDRYLHTSPEWEMKKALVAGSGSIYQMAHVFRDDLHENWHKPAFLMLEWYEIGIDDTQLIQRCLNLLQILGVSESPKICTVFELYQKYCGIYLNQCDIVTLQSYTQSQGINSDQLAEPNHLSSWLELIWVNQIEPNLRGLVVVKDFPLCQSALARVVSSPYPHAKRFEIFLHGCELANGYYEATDAAVLEQRFRGYSGPYKTVYAGDMKGLPNCSGVSVGLERLFALIQGKSRLE